MHAATAADFEAAIARLERRDPQSPEAMNARLEYADFLLQTESGDCRNRLDDAQAQIDAVASRPAVDILLPMGPARLANGAYQLHAARATCDPQVRQGELQQALDAARKASSLYRDALDYQSAAVMQFNAAVTLHDMGQDEPAIAALRSAIAMDREFGFRDDAQDNIRLLLRWTNQDQGDDDIAREMKDFPARTAEFKFGWSDSDTELSVTVENADLLDGNVIHSRGTNLLKRHVRQDQRNWAVSYDAGTPIYDMGNWPEKNGSWVFSNYLLTSALLDYPKFGVNQRGDFETVRDAGTLGSSLSQEISTRLAGTPGLDEPPGGTMSWSQSLKAVFQPPYIEADASQTYNVQTGAWIGAKLEQGVWYRMTAPLFLPGLGMGKYMVTHDIEFSYSRQVPCTADATDLSCAEVVVHATPNPKDLALARQQVARLLQISPDRLHYWSTTSLRLVIKPGTLVPYISETRRSWYGAVDGASKDKVLISSERIVSATRS